MTWPRSFPSRSGVPDAAPSAAQSSGWSRAVGRFSRAREEGVSVNVEFRKLRAGAATSRKGFPAVGPSITSKWSGRVGIRAPRSP
jgi:hypothetical protein